MEKNSIEKANSGLARLKRRRLKENNSNILPPAKKSYSQLNQTSSSNNFSSQYVSTPLSTITNTEQLQPSPNTEPNNALHQIPKPIPTYPNTRHAAKNLFDKFTAAMNSHPSTSNPDQASHSSSPIMEPPPPSASEHNYDSDSSTDSEVEIYLDEISSSDSETEHTNDHHSIRNNKSSTQTGNPALQGYDDLGDAICECEECGSFMWYDERKAKAKHTSVPKFQICCGNGKVQLPNLKHAPPILQHLLFDSTSPDSKLYQQNTRVYNSMFSFTSPGMEMDKFNSSGRGPPTLRIQGQTCHRIGTMLPEIGETPKYAQLYIYDTENEIDNRMQIFRNSKGINKEIVGNLSKMLDDHNVHAKGFRMARDLLKDGHIEDLKLKLISERKTDGRIYNQPTVSEVAALIVGDVDSAERRDIILHKTGGKLQRIDEFHPAYLSYQYPLIFPYGEDGYRDGILLKYKDETVVTKRNRLTIKAWLAYRIQQRKNDARTLLCSRRLFQQFLVDGFTMMEADRLNWLRRNQSKLRVGKYHNLNDNILNGNGQPKQKRGKRVILPSSFVGSRRYLDQLYFDGMAISSKIGFPDIFLTFTCNPNWPEIQRELGKHNLNPQDRPDLITRVFKMKFDALMKDLTRNHILGRVLAYLYTIEFQKRGLPHAHILIFLHPASKYPKPADIDSIISAEIPHPNSQKELYELVKKHMMHGPCGPKISSPCMKNDKCSKFFPKKWKEETVVDAEGFPVYRRRNNGRSIIKSKIKLDNRHVVPYNPKLLLKYQAHINMEWCNQRTSIKYLFKYIHKGYDRISATVVQNNGALQEIDEIKQYIDCRYISPSEACWRIFGFSIHGRRPAVERMFFHLIGENSVYLTDNQDVEHVLEKPSVTESMFTAWFQANSSYSEARKLTYGEFVTNFVYVKKKRCWTPRKRGYTIGRLVWVPPCTGELFYLRMMLTVLKGPLTYEGMKNIAGVQLKTFREACFEMGMLGDDKEFIGAIKEAKAWGSGFALRFLFVTMLLGATLDRPGYVWKNTVQWLSEDILYQQRRIARNPDLQLTNDQIENLTLLEIEKLLENDRRSLKEFKCMPYPKDYVTADLGNRLIYDEHHYDVNLLTEEFNNLFKCLTDEQKIIFEKIMKAVDNQNGGVFFLHGYGGTGKTFMWKTLSAALRSKMQIVLTVASSGIASLLLPGGRTAHSKFKIPVPCEDNATCKIEYGDDRAELLQQTRLIIWDEAPMAHRYCFEALDTTLKDIMCPVGNSEKVFGGKVVVFGGDFRQILPVIPRGSRSDIVHATLNASKIWHHCEVLTLTKNMRLQCGSSQLEKNEMEEFSKWILRIGEGRIGEPNDGIVDIEIPQDLLITKFDDPIQAIVTSTYPNLLDNYLNYDFLSVRAILASTIEVVEEINNFVLTLLPGEEKEYLSADKLDNSEINDQSHFNVLTPEFLNSLRMSGLPNHKIKLKIGTPIMLMRNIAQSQGLCNGTRLIVTQLGTHVLAAEVISGEHKGEMIFIPRSEISPSQSPWPFKLIRRQFPIMVSYAMTINKSQGQSLDCVGLYLPKPVFSHGQLYVAISRVKSKKGLKILILDEDGKATNTTTNVVFKEVFQNI